MGVFEEVHDVVDAHIKILVAFGVSEGDSITILSSFRADLMTVLLINNFSPEEEEDDGKLRVEEREGGGFAVELP